ncbi:MAG: hypothetical protein KatS3mg057_1802 [Herpetosiphonaceae bacterium]|nr:MAG: hypothetical protein KatS3mg057_1802 [Herpetosiphonaceae bacterium]
MGKTTEDVYAELEALRQRVADLEQTISFYKQAEARTRLLLESIKDYAIFMLDPLGRIASWSSGAERMHGYRSDEINGQPSSLFYPADALQRGLSEQVLAAAAAEGHYEFEGWLVRKDGSRLWANMIIAALRDPTGELIGFSVVTRDLTERKRTEDMIRYHAYHDVLTGLPNRTLLNDRMAMAMAQARRNNHMAAVLFFDLDRFKLINDTLGHAVGDQLLKGVAERLSGIIRATDTLVRLGGDEFILIASPIQRADDATTVAQKVIDSLSTPFSLRGHELYISTSIGVSIYPRDGEDGETLLKNADAALYRAKDQGRGNYQLYTVDMNAQAFERLAVENALRKALEGEEGNELQIYYQPQVDLSSGQIVGVEALLRWQHPYLGLVPPEQFIPVAEEVGLIIPIENWVLLTACTHNKALQDAGLGPLRVAVNLSIRRFRQPGLLEMVRQVLDQTRLAPQHLELEIAESVAMQDVEFTIAMLRELKALAIHISIDDFGTGYSSFNYLKGSLVDSLKIDHSFVRDITGNADSRAIARSIIKLAHSLHMQVIAEGVETNEQFALLRAEGCDKIQGYVFSKPLPIAGLIQLLTERRRLRLPPESTGEIQPIN